MTGDLTIEDETRPVPTGAPPPPEAQDAPPRPTGAGSRARRPVLLALAAAAVLLGVAMRVWVLVSPLRYVDSDEATVGLMARHTLDGHLEAFFWGQDYGSAHESTLSALLMAVGVPDTLALKLGPMVFFALAAVFLWRIAARVVDRHAALLTGALLFAAPAANVWMSTKARGFYGATLALGLGAVLFALRWEDGWRWRDALVLGLLAGSAWYASPQSVYLLAPAAAWLGVRVLRARPWRALARTAPVVAAGAVAGALPWLWANLNGGWASLHTPAGLPRTTEGYRFDLFADRGLPVVLGLRNMFSGGWYGGRLGQVLYPAALVVLAGGVLLARRRPKALVPLLFLAALYPLVFSTLPTSFYVDDPRYLTFLPPALLVTGVWVAARAGWPAVAAVAAGVLVLAAVGVFRVGVDEQRGRWDVVAEDVAPVVDALDARGIDRAFAEYWIAHRVDFATGERIVAAPLELIRHVPYEEEVRREARPAYVMFDGGPQYGWLVEHLDEHGIGYRRTPVRHYVIVEPDARVLPEDVDRLWARTRAGLET